MVDGEIWCISHSDLDGMSSAACVRDRYPRANIMITNYNKYRNLYKIKPGSTVFITDFTLRIDEFQRLSQKQCKIIWIDHHKANYDEIYAQEPNMRKCDGVRRDDYCGAALTWMYLHPNMPPEVMPEAIKLVNDYDLWLFKDPRTKDFSYGSGLWDIRPGNENGDKFWSALLANDDSMFQKVLKYGGHICKYVEMLQDTVCRDIAYYTSIPTPSGNKNILAITVRAGNSSIFDRMNKDNVDAVFTGQYVANIGHYRCSMYSPDNVKEILPIVQMFGGGGHPKAAGFSMDNFPIPYPTVREPRPMQEALNDYKALYKTKMASIILKQWIDRASSISMKATSFHTDFCNYSAIATNHQYLPELLSVSTTSTDSIDPKTSLPAKLYFGWCMTNTGWFRNCVFPTDTSTNMQEVKEDILKTYPEAAKTLTEDGGGLWWYSKELAIRPPITPIAPVIQAKM